MSPIISSTEFERLQPITRRIGIDNGDNRPTINANRDRRLIMDASADNRFVIHIRSGGDESLISRAAARSVLARVPESDEVLLDFAGVRSVG